VASEESARWHGSGLGVVDRCGRGVRARRNDGRGINDGGGGAMWEASAGGDQLRMMHTGGLTESFDLLAV
jgi:hypothetical protein